MNLLIKDSVHYQRNKKVFINGETKKEVIFCFPLHSSSKSHSFEDLNLKTELICIMFLNKVRKCT